VLINKKSNRPTTTIELACSISHLDVAEFLFVGLYDEVTEMKKACGAAHLKTILATGELGSLSNVYKASLVCMMAG